MKKKMLIILSLVLIILLLVSVVPLKRNIDTVLRGIQWRIGDSNYSENVKIAVKGTYKQYLLNILRKDTFKGQINIDNYESTKNSEVQELVFRDEFTSLSYDDKNDEFLNSPIYFGIINCSPNFNKIDIGVAEEDDRGILGWSGENRLMITAPANKIEEAISVSKDVSKMIWKNSAQNAGY